MSFSSIQQHWREAFELAVKRFRDWNYGIPEPTVSVGTQPFNLQKIYGLASTLPGQVPDEIYDLACQWAAELRNGNEGRGYPCEGPHDRSYASVASCMIRLSGVKIAYFRRLMERN